MSLKDDLDLENQQIFTLSQSELEFLTSIAKTMQEELDRVQQIVATAYLQHVASNRFEYGLHDKLEFKLDMQKYHNNLTIIKHDK